MMSDRGHPRFKNLKSTAPIDAVRIGSLFNVNSLSTRVQVRVWVNKRNLVQEQSDVCVCEYIPVIVLIPKTGFVFLTNTQ